MNKRLVCLTLSILMLLTCVFASCSPKTTDSDSADETVDNSAKTITMWVVTNDETTDEAKKAVNDAFAKITKAKFKTNVVIRFCTEDEYYSKLEAAIEANQYEIELEAQCAKDLRRYINSHKGEGKDKATLTAEFYAAHPEYQKFQKQENEDEENAVETEEETQINEFGITEIKYPDADANQVDIFYLSGYDRYMEYYRNEYLSPLSEELSSTSKKLTTYISSSLINGVQIEGDVYAIPNNVPIGEYTYMMIDKELFDTYYQKIDKVGSVLDLEVFLNDVKNHNGDKTADDPGYVVPLASSYQECLKMLCWYWDLSYVDQSVYKMYYDEATGRSYVLQHQYEVTIEETNDKGETVTKKETRVSPLVESDILYKINDKGQFVDEEGNPLNYRYEIDAESGWLYDEKKNKYEYSADAKGALYLVDEDGNAVTEENDKRVVIGGDTKIDKDANVLPTYYYSYDEDAEFSILGAMMKDAASRTRGSVNLGFNTLFTDAEYHQLFAALKNYEYQEFYGEVKEGQRAAVSFMKGDSRVKQDYEKNGVYVGEDGREYYVVVAEYPEATEEELYGNMFAVYSNSKYLARSMEVITYLNTNQELRNLLQYGIQGQHYEFNENGTVKLLHDAKYGIYSMDIEKTGNCFIASPTEEMGVDAWTYAKLQNNDSLINPLLGFDFNQAIADSDYSIDTVLIDEIKRLNAETLAQIEECSNKDDLMSLMSDATDGLIVQHDPIKTPNEKLEKAINSLYDPDTANDKSGNSPYAVYYTWLTTYGYLYTPSVED
ncbi:MAG: hypothetical protein IKM33_00865 [Clostridia bacterium]|nr:hypothetical protein [Clostridia bacterium]